MPNKWLPQANERGIGRKGAGHSSWRAWSYLNHLTSECWETFRHKGWVRPEKNPYFCCERIWCTRTELRVHANHWPVWLKPGPGARLSWKTEVWEKYLSGALKKLLRWRLQHHGEVWFWNCSSSDWQGMAGALNKSTNKGFCPTVVLTCSHHH